MEGHEVPETVTYLGKVLPPAIMVILVIYCVKGINLGFRMVPHTEDLMERHHEIPPPFLRMGRHRRIANPYALPAVGHVRLDRKHAGTAVFPAQLP